MNALENALDAIMAENSGIKGVRVLYSAYCAVVHVMCAEAAWLRRHAGVEFAHEADCLESQARSAEQNYARMMRAAVARESGGRSSTRVAI